MIIMSSPAQIASFRPNKNLNSQAFGIQLDSPR